MTGQLVWNLLVKASPILIPFFVVLAGLGLFRRMFK